MISWLPLWLLSEKWHKKSRKPFKDFLLGGVAGGRLVFSLESYYGLPHKCPNKQVGALPEE